MNKNNLSHLATASSISWLLDVGGFYGTLTETQARALAAVNRTTFTRWLRGQSSAPAATLELLRLHAFGEPPGGFGSKDWRGFRFQNGALHSPYGDIFTPAELRAFWIYRRSGRPYAEIAGEQARLINAA